MKCSYLTCVYILWTTDDQPCFVLEVERTNHYEQHEIPKIKDLAQ